MHGPSHSTPRAATITPRAIRLQLRDGDWVVGGVYLTDGQALAPYVGSRKGGWLNVVQARWASEGVLHPHAVVQADDVVWARSTDPQIRVAPISATAVPREVDILLEDGSRLIGSIQVMAKQRLSDFLSSCGGFLPVIGAARPHGGDSYGDIALNARCVKAVRDGRMQAWDADADAPGRAEWGGLRQPIAFDPTEAMDEPGSAGR